MGSLASDSQIEAMLKEAPGPINFTVFLTLFGERLTGTDPEATIVGAFAMFDKKVPSFVSTPIQSFSSCIESTTHLLHFCMAFINWV